MKHKILFYITSLLLVRKKKIKNNYSLFYHPDKATIPFGNDIDETKLPGNALNEFA